MRLFTLASLFTLFSPTIFLGTSAQFTAESVPIISLHDGEIAWATPEQKRKVAKDVFERSNKSIFIGATKDVLQGIRLLNNSTLLAGIQESPSRQRAVPQTQETVLLANARRLRLQGQHLRAADAYSQFIREYPKSSRLYEARFWYAKSVFADEKWQEAARGFTSFLNNHSDQRTYSQQAKEDRIYCWKVLYKQSPSAASGLVEALKDSNQDVRILAALALAENQNTAGRRILEEGINHTKFGEQCGLGLWKLGLRRQPTPREGPLPQSRILVVKVKTEEDRFESRIPVNFISFILKNLPEEAKEQLVLNGISDISELAKLASTAPKGYVLFKYEGNKGKTSVVIMFD